MYDPRNYVRRFYSWHYCYLHISMLVVPYSYFKSSYLGNNQWLFLFAALSAYFRQNYFYSVIDFQHKSGYSNMECNWLIANIIVAKINEKVFFIDVKVLWNATNCMRKEKRFINSGNLECQWNPKHFRMSWYHLIISIL